MFCFYSCLRFCFHTGYGLCMDLGLSVLGFRWVFVFRFRSLAQGHGARLGMSFSLHIQVD